MHLDTRVGVRRRRGRAAAFACQEHSSALGAELCFARNAAANHSGPTGFDRYRVEAEATARLEAGIATAADEKGK
jgi:hypothetical protein